MWEEKYFTARKSDSGKFHSLHTLNVNLDLIHEKYSALGGGKKPSVGIPVQTETKGKINMLI